MNASLELPTGPLIQPRANDETVSYYAEDILWRHEARLKANFLFWRYFQQADCSLRKFESESQVRKWKAFKVISSKEKHNRPKNWKKGKKKKLVGGRVEFESLELDAEKQV